MIFRSGVRLKTTKMRAEYAQSGINGTTPIKGLDTLSERVLAIMTLHSADGDESVESGAPHLPDVSKNLIKITNMPFYLNKFVTLML